MTVVSFPSPFGVSAFASRVILSPAGLYAFLTVGLPVLSDWTQTGFPRSTCVRHGRNGRPLYPGDNGAHPTACRSTVGICRIPAARPYSRPGPASLPSGPST